VARRAREAAENVTPRGVSLALAASSSIEVRRNRKATAWLARDPRQEPRCRRAPPRPHAPIGNASRGRIAGLANARAAAVIAADFFSRRPDPK